MRIDDDTTAHDLLINEWQYVGNETRVIRSHRRPRQSRRGPASLIALAAAVALGITSVAHTTAPDDSRVVTASQGGEFVVPPTISIDDLIKRSQEPASRSEREVISQQFKTLRQAEKAKSTPKVPSKPKPPTSRWVNAVAKVKVTSCYGPRNGGTHKGMDFDGETGDKIRSVGSGTVVQAGWRYSGLGYSVVVKHANGWMTLYGHLSKVTARTGQKVSAGDLVGLMGSTGKSTGSHLHLGVAKTSSLGSLFNTLTNPAPWLKSRGLATGKC